MNENQKMPDAAIAKWLRVMLYTAAVSVTVSVLNSLPFIPDAITSWISLGTIVTMVICMFQLAPVNGRYRKAGILVAVMFGCALIAALVKLGSILTLAVSVLGIIATYQEYTAHSELICEKDPTLARNWHSLFNWSIVVGVLVAFASLVTTMIAALVGANPTRIVNLVVGVLGIPQTVIKVVYLLYLKKMVAYFRVAAGE